MFPSPLEQLVGATCSCLAASLTVSHPAGKATEDSVIKTTGAEGTEILSPASDYVAAPRLVRLMRTPAQSSLDTSLGIIQPSPAPQVSTPLSLNFHERPLSQDSNPHMAHTC